MATTHPAPPPPPFVFPIDPFDGDVHLFRRWKESVQLLLRTLDLARVLFEPRPSDIDAPDAARRWDRDDALCRGHILRALSDRLFHLHVHRPSSRSLWHALHMTYDLDDEVARLGAIRRFAAFKMVDDNGVSVLEQMSELQRIIHLAFPHRPDALPQPVIESVIEALPSSASWAGVVAAAKGKNLSMHEVWSLVREHEVRLRKLEDDGALTLDDVFKKLARRKTIS